MFGLKRFHLYLYGRYFTILTDHKPLERVFGPKTVIPSLAAMRLPRWAIIRRLAVKELSSRLKSV